MEKTIKSWLETFIRSKDLFYAFSLLMSYFLGLGLLHYLGQSVDCSQVVLGLGYSVMVFFSGSLLTTYFQTSGRTNEDKGSKEKKTGQIDKQSTLTAGLAILAVAFVLAYFLCLSASKPVETISLVAITFLLLLVFAIPPVNVNARGYGELVLVVWIIILVPALAFVSQGNTMHPLIPIITFPLAALFLSTIIATSLEGYLGDMVSGRKTLVIMLGWKLAMNLYNWLVLFAYVFIGTASIIRLPWNLTWPLLLPLPIYLFTGYEINRIKEGVKPRWPLLALTGYAGAGCMLYVLLVALWV